MEEFGEKVKSKGNELIKAFGHKHALMVCVEMNIEHIHFAGTHFTERTTFWKDVKKYIEKQGL